MTAAPELRHRGEFLRHRGISLRDRGVPFPGHATEFQKNHALVKIL